ncbi:Las1-like-domain-containing protein [Aspergillus aurantiobrunneus]
MSKVTFTPWKTTSDLLSVRAQFYPPPEYTGPDLRSRACATVAAWKLRGNLPHPVEATALLTDAILHDDAAKNSVFAIRATYAAAFCRFVTGLVDNKLHGARKTMFSRAADLGLPASFVELRHEATHRELPSLTVLRDAVARSLDWLWGFYWGAISGGLVGFGVGLADGDDQDARLGEVLGGSVMQAAELVIGDGNGNGAEPSRKKRRTQQGLAGVAAQVVDVLKGSGTEAARVLARVMLREGVLVPSSRRLGDSLTDIISKWDPLIHLITEGHPSFLATLTETMADELAFSSGSSTKSDPFCEAVYTWLDHVLRSPQWALHRRVMSFSYIRAVCEERKNCWTGLVTASIEKLGDGDDLLTAVRRGSGEAGPKPVDDDDLKTLSRFGWETANTWDSRPLGIVT